MENNVQNSGEEKKIRFDSGRIIKGLCGVVLIVFAFSQGIYIPISGEAIGYDFIPFAIIIFGCLLLYSALKRKNKIADKKFWRNFWIAVGVVVGITVVCMIIWSIGTILSK